MRILTKLLTLSLFSIMAAANAQTIAGYSFEKYAVKKQVHSGKAKIDYKSNPIAKTFKTAIIDGYNAGKVDFAGYYITVFWGCGNGCVSGAMVDTRDGKVYDVPVNEHTAKNFCYQDDDPKENETIKFEANSRLFITTICYETYIKKTAKLEQEKDFLINVWNEQKKKFDVIKTVRKTYTKKANQYTISVNE